VTGRWFSPVSITNTTARQDVTEIMFKVALNTISLAYLNNTNSLVKLLPAHPELGVLVDKTTNVHGQVQMDGRLAHFHFEGGYLLLHSSHSQPF
jgi:hypothetical protein